MLCTNRLRPGVRSAAYGDMHYNQSLIHHCITWQIILVGEKYNEIQQ